MDGSLSEYEEHSLKASRKERFNNSLSTNRYVELKDARETQRQQLIAQGIISDPTKRTSLADAKPLVGTCTSMCPDFEREQREYQNNLDRHELIPGTRCADPARAVKTFHRSAAGNEEPLPSDVRTPETLLKTLDYLINVIVAGNQTLEGCHGFVRDRTRSIRQDFTLQNIRDLSAIAAHERIARFHIVAMHILCGNKDFAEHQDMEQLRKVLKTLIELYDDHRRMGVACPNEPEFYAYYIVAHLRDSDAKRVAERLPVHIFTAPVVQQALKLHMLSQTSNEVVSRQQPPNLFAAQNLTTQFFRAVASNSTPLLLACLAEYEFPSIRRAGLKAINMAFPHQRGKEYPVEDFSSMFAFDSEDEVVQFCALFNIPVNQGGVMLGAKLDKRLVYKEPDNRPKRTQRNIRAVGFKFQMMTPMQAINSDLSARFLLPGPLSVAMQRRGIAKRVSFATTDATVRNKPGIALQPAFSAAAATITAAAESAAELAFNKAFAPESSPAKLHSLQPGAVASRSLAFEKTATPASTSTDRPINKADLQPAPPSGLFANLAPQKTEARADSTTVAMPVPSPGLAGLVPLQPATAPTESKDESAKRTSVPLLKNVASAQSSTQPAGTSIQPAVAADIVWNRPRQRINWTSLCNSLFDDLIRSQLYEIAQPVLDRSRRNKGVADVLASDIAGAIADYTSAFVAYEEAYRSTLFAKADCFQRRAALRAAFARWGMELTVRQQESALHQQRIDELEEIVDSEYMRHDSAAAELYQSHTKEPAKHRQSTLVSVAPDAFWESCHLGSGGFDAVCRSLKRLGNPPFDLGVSVTGTANDSVLSSWLWWQIDPNSASSSVGYPNRSVEYSSGSQRLIIEETEQCGFSTNTSIQASQLWAKVVQLSPHPVNDDGSGGDHDHGNSGDQSNNKVSLASVDIATRVENIASMLGANDTNRPSCALFLLWCSSSKAGRAVCKLVEGRIRNGCMPSSSIKVVALDIASPKQQLVSGFKWMYSRLYHSRQAMLVKASKAFEAIRSSMTQALRRMHGCVIGVLKAQCNGPSTPPIVNKAVDIANAFVNVLIAHVFGAGSSIKVQEYPRMSEDTLSRDFFVRCISITSVSSEQSNRPLLKTNALVCGAIDEMLASSQVLDSQQQQQQPTLDGCLCAFEYVVRHQLDVLQQAISSDMYTEKHAVSAALERAIKTSEVLITECLRLCQDESFAMADFATPRIKRTSSLAFSSVSPPSTSSGSNLASSTTVQSSLNATKRLRPASSLKLSRLQNAIAHASKQLG
ncbi:actin cytoskeleton and mitosis protein [Dipsacomyces acuminosporus]|nr:actin cytoskeleton and mitosis protein [Dipsacomyces acuminosporus]